MSIEQRIPDLSDKELETLNANAVRLAASGTLQQREHAERLLPLLAVALEEREAARAQAREEKRKTSTARRKATVARTKSEASK